MNKRADEILAEAAQTFKERNAVYGDNWKQVGDAMQALFPFGITLKTPNDWNRMHILMLTVVKWTRYVNNWELGGHADSVHDAMVYSAMLEAIDAGIKEEKEPPNAKYAGSIRAFRLCATCDKSATCQRTETCQQKIRITGLHKHVDE